MGRFGSSRPRKPEEVLGTGAYYFRISAMQDVSYRILAFRTVPAVRSAKLKPAVA